MIIEPLHIVERVLDLVLTDAPDLVEVRVGTSVGTSDHSVIFMDIVLQQPIPISRRLIYIGRRFILYRQ